MSIYNRLASTVNGLIRPLGYQVVRLPSPPMNCRFKALLNSRIDLVIDVGANRGQYAQDIRAGGYTGRILSLEPLPDAFADLALAASRDSKWEVLNAAAGDAPGRLPMHVSHNSVSSSILAVTEASTAAAPGSDVHTTVEVEVLALRDTLLREVNSRILVKIDTQGYEWQVLQGCGDQLRNALLLDVEMSLQPLYTGQRLWDEVDPWIRAQGYTAFGLDTAFWNRSTGELLQVDGLYRRK